MKGFVTDIGFTVAVLVTAVIVILAMLVLFVIFEFKGKDPMSYSLDFVDLSNKPYLLSGSLLHLKIDDRQFIEHAIEASVVGSFESSGYDALHDKLKEFLDKYGLEYYSVEIKGDNAVLSLNNLFPACGEKKEGVCVNLWHKTISECGTLREEVQPNDCGGDLTCCKYVVEADYDPSDHHGLHVFYCGNYGRGVCDFECDETQIELEEGKEDCKGTNNDNSPYCCAPKTSENVIITGYATSAEIPLFYRDKFSSMVVTVSE